MRSEQRSRDPRPVPLDFERSAPAPVPEIAEVPARTGIHGRGEHEARGIGERQRGTTQRDHAILERLSEHLQDITTEFGQFVEKEHTAVGQAHLTRPGRGAASDESGIADRVVRRTEGP